MENKGITTEEIIKIKPGTSISMILPANKCYLFCQADGISGTVQVPEA